MKILIVEDDSISRMVLEKQLSFYGEVDVAVNGRKALDAVQMQLEQGAPYNLICLDIMMPELAGQEALRKIRAAEKNSGMAEFERAQIIMTTALSESKDILSSFRDECDGYLVKPIKKQDIKKLFDVLEIEPPDN